MKKTRWFDSMMPLSKPSELPSGLFEDKMSDLVLEPSVVLPRKKKPSGGTPEADWEEDDLVDEDNPDEELDEDDEI
jgi:hypothetical protein